MKPACWQPGTGAAGNTVPWPCLRLRSWGDGCGGAWWLPGDISRSFPNGLPGGLSEKDVAEQAAWSPCSPALLLLPFPITPSVLMATTCSESAAAIPVAAASKQGVWLVLCNQSF